MLPPNFTLTIQPAPNDRFSLSCTFDAGGTRHSSSSDSLRTEHDVILHILEQLTKATAAMAYGLYTAVLALAAAPDLVEARKRATAAADTVVGAAEADVSDALRKARKRTVRKGSRPRWTKSSSSRPKTSKPGSPAS